MGYYKGKDKSDKALDPDYERLRRERNLLRLENKRLNKENAILLVENSSNRMKIATLDSLVAVIDQFYSQNKTEVMKYLYSVAHKHDDYDLGSMDNHDELDENF